MRPILSSLLIGAAVLGGCHVAKDPEVELGGGGPPVAPVAGLFVESRSGNGAAFDLAAVSPTSLDPRAVLLERADTPVIAFDGVVVRVNGGESYNPVTRLVDQFGVRALVYRKGGLLFKVLLKPDSGNLTAVRLSSEAQATALREGALRAQSYRGTEAVIAYNGGPAATERYVFLSMDAASLPREAPVFNSRLGRMIAGINNQTTGALEGFLFEDGERIYRTDLNFGNPQTVLQPAGAIAVSANTGRAFYFVTNSNVLYRYDLVGAHAVAPAISINGIVRSLQFDATNVYAFVERTNIAKRAVVKIPDRSSPSVVDLLIDLTDAPPRLTPDFVVARNLNGFIANRKDRDNTSGATTFLAGVPILLPFDNASGNRVFYDAALLDIASVAVDVNGDNPEQQRTRKRITVAAPSSVLGAKVILPIADIGITRLLVAENAGDGRIKGLFQWVDAGTGGVQFGLGSVPAAPAAHIESSALPAFVAGAGTFVLDQNGVRTAFRVRESADPVVRIPNP